MLVHLMSSLIVLSPVSITKKNPEASKKVEKDALDSVNFQSKFINQKAQKGNSGFL